MSSKDKKRPKLSDSQSASSLASSYSDSSPPPRKDARTKSNSVNDSVYPKGNTNGLRVEGEKEPAWELGSKKFVTIGDFCAEYYF